MDRYTNEQRLIIVKTYYKNGECSAETVRKLGNIFGLKNAPHKSTVQRLIKKFEKTYSLVDMKPTGRHRTCRTASQIATVKDIITKSPKTSIRQLSKQSGLSRSTIQRILTKDLNLQPYKVGGNPKTTTSESTDWSQEANHVSYMDRALTSDEAEVAKITPSTLQPHSNQCYSNLGAARNR